MSRPLTRGFDKKNYSPTKDYQLYQPRLDESRRVHGKCYL